MSAQTNNTVPAWRKDNHFFSSFADKEAEMSLTVNGDILLSAGVSSENGKLTLSKYGYVVFIEV